MSLDLLTQGPRELFKVGSVGSFDIKREKLYGKWLESILQEDKEFTLKELKFDGINLGTDQLCVCAYIHTHRYLISTYILFSSYGKGNDGSYLELAIGK